MEPTKKEAADQNSEERRGGEVSKSIKRE